VCIADRRAEDCDFALPVYAALKLSIDSYEPDDCPICREGKIKLVKKYPGPVTVHDPCNVIRGRGLHEKLRELVNFLVEGGIVETASNREHNFCCAAGGGVINTGPPFKNVRVAGSKCKADELKATGVKTIVAPCHNCHGGLEDTVHSYKLGMEIKFLGDIIYECMEKPEL